MECTCGVGQVASRPLSSGRFEGRQAVQVREGQQNRPERGSAGASTSTRNRCHLGPHLERPDHAETGGGPGHQLHVPHLR